MKIQKLQIQNIASIENATIDFTAQPLCDSDVYLITGDTGAGKTTILDSICLALFNNTPRLARGNDKTVINNGIDALSLRDPKRMMRRNTGEALIKLFFEANGDCYEVEWHVQRGQKKKATNQMSSVDRKLTNLATGDYLTGKGTKDKELQDEIQKIIGLDFNQFCRTTMLAQNEFTKFLASSEDERAEILEKITKTNFSIVGSKVYEITSQKRTDWQNAQQAANNTGLTDAEIKQKEDDLVTLNADCNTKIVERNRADIKKKWFDAEADLAKEEKNAKADYDNACKQLEGDEYKESFIFAQQWNATIEARQKLRKHREAEATIKEQEKQLSDQERLFREVLGGYQYDEKRLQNLRTEQEQITSFLDTNRDRTITFDNVQTIVAHLNTIIAKSQQIGILDKKIQESEKQLAATLLPQREEAKKQVDETERESKVLKEEILSKRNELEKLDLPSLRREREEVKELLTNIRQAIEAVRDIDSKKEAREKERICIEQLKCSIEQNEKELTEQLLPAYVAAKKRKEAAEMSKEMLRNSVDKFAKQMRTHLSVGCECPVCRQKVAVLPLEAEIDELYAEAENQYEDAKKDYINAESAKNKSEAGIQSEKKRYDEDKKRYDADQSVADAEAKAVKCCQKCGISALTEHVVDDLEKLQADKTTRLTTVLNPNIKVAETCEKTLKELQDKSDQIAEKYKKKDKAHQTASKKVDECQTAIVNYQHSLQQNKEENSRAMEHVQPLIASATWQYDWMTEPEKFRNDLQSSSDTYFKKKSRQEEIERLSAPLQKTLENVSSVITQIRQECGAWRKVGPVSAHQLNNLLMTATNVLQAVGVITNTLKNARQNFSEMSDCLDLFIEEHPELSIHRLEELNKTSSIEALVGRLEQQRKDKEKKEALFNKALNDHSHHQTKKPPLMSPFDTYQSVVNDYNTADQKITQLNQQIGIINNDLIIDQQLKQGLAALIREEKIARAEYEKWDRLNKLIGDKEGKTFRNIAQSYIFDGLLYYANSYLQKLEPRYTLKAVDGTLYSSLEDAYQGFSSRDTGSLSGGESFLVSLALALALSDIGQGLTVDTLFIDEGFGSLSGQALTNAINTLRSLRGTNGRHVGIISHIKEVRESIPVQIQVNKSPLSSSSVVEII